MKITEEIVRERLQGVLDPELHLSIIDLGLVYKIAIKKDTIAIQMTLTSIGCPLFPVIEAEIKEKLKPLGFGAENITITLTFDPPWSMEHLTESGRASLGI